MTALKFRPDIHQFSIGDEILPSTTQVLVAEGFVNTDWYTEDGRERGSIRHNLLHLHDTGELIEDEIMPEYAPVLKAYKEFLNQTGLRVLESEVPRYHKTLRYAGIPDRIVELGKYISVIDIKPKGKEPWHCLQTAAYAEIVKQDLNVAVVKRYGLHIGMDGKWNLEEHGNRQDAGIWMAIMAIHNWKKTYRR